jgi:nucleotide-binding universal stress UspA family protein
LHDGSPQPEVGHDGFHHLLVPVDFRLCPSSLSAAKRPNLRSPFAIHPLRQRHLGEPTMPPSFALLSTTMNPTPDIRHVLVAHDFSETADAALDYALGLAQKLGARVTVVHAYENPSHGAPEVLVLATDWTKQFEVVARDALDKVIVGVRKRGLDADSALRNGTAWREINASAAEAKADLIVIGTEGRSGLGRALLGSVAEKVVRTAPCPVLVVRRGPP